MASEPDDWPPQPPHVGDFPVSFAFHIDPVEYLGRGIEAANRSGHTDETYLDVVNSIYVPALLTDLEASAPGLKVELEPWGGPSTAGPGGTEDLQLLTLVGPVGDAIGRIVDLAAFAVLVRAGIHAIRDRTGSPPKISDGLALILAADHLAQTIGASDLTLASLSPVRAHPDGAEWFGGPDEGFLVGYRDAERLYVVFVSSRGEPTTVTTEALHLPK